MAHIPGQREYWATSPCVRQDYTEDPLLPQKALPLPDDLEVDIALQNGPDDVLAAAASAMEACDALPEGVAESVMQPLAEAYLLAVRREARLLPDVVSAASAKSRRRKDHSSENKDSASLSDASRMPKEPCVCVTERNIPDGILHTSKYAYPTKTVAVEAVSSSAHTAGHTTPALPYADYTCTRTSQSEAARPSNEISPLGETSEQASSSSLTSKASPSEGSISSEEENLADSKESLAQSSSRELRNAEGTQKETEAARSGGAGKSRKEGSRVIRVVGESGETLRCEERANQSRHIDANDDLDAYIASQEKSAENSSNVSGKGANLSTGVTEESCAAGPNFSLRSGDRAGDDSNGYHVALEGITRGTSLSCKTTATEGVLSTGTPVFARDCTTVGASTRRPPPKKSEKCSKDTRQKLAAYVDRLVLLDKQREAASASASAPAATWRATVLQQFKDLRRFVSSDEFIVEEYPQPGTAADCSTWTEQEWRLYCRLYPPSLGLLGRCDTMTLCRLFFLLVEDLKQQQRNIAKTHREGGSHSNSGTCALAHVRGSQHLPEHASEHAEKEVSTSASTLPAPHPMPVNAGAEFAQGGDRVSVAQNQRDQAQEKIESNSERKSNSTDGRLFSGSYMHYQEGECSDTATREDKGGVSAATEHSVDQHIQGTNSSVHASEENDANKVARLWRTSCTGSCRCCTHCDCCVTLQQASWIFGIFVFLDELQAMEADAAACIQQLRRLCESARERAAACPAASQCLPPTRHSAGDSTEKTPGAQGEAVLPMFCGKPATMVVPTDLVAALNLLIVVINDFFNQR